MLPLLSITLEVDYSAWETYKTYYSSDHPTEYAQNWYLQGLSLCKSDTGYARQDNTLIYGTGRGNDHNSQVSWDTDPLSVQAPYTPNT